MENNMMHQLFTSWRFDQSLKEKVKSSSALCRLLQTHDIQQQQEESDLTAATLIWPVREIKTEDVYISLKQSQLPQS